MAKKEDRKRVDNKYARREFLKASARIGAGATIYGMGGYLLGRGYQSMKELYNQNIKPPIEALEKGAKQTENMLNNYKREAKIFLRGENAVKAKEDKEWKERVQEINQLKEEKQKAGKEILSKRALLQYPVNYLKQVHNSPTSTLAITGAAYGATKSTIRAIPRYLTKRKIAILMDKNASYEKRISALEEYKKAIENSNERKEEEIEKELERVKSLLENAKRASGKLETIVEDSQKENILLISLGLTGLIASFIMNLPQVSGFIIVESTSFSPIGLSILFFLASLILIFLGTRKRKIKIVQKNPYKFFKENI